MLRSSSLRFLRTLGTLRYNAVSFAQTDACCSKNRPSGLLTRITVAETTTRRRLVMDTYPQPPSSHNERPQQFQLEFIRQRLELTVPLLFRHQLDYTFYHKQVEFEDGVIGVRSSGLQLYRAYLGAVNMIGLLCYPHIHIEALSIIPILEDGTVRLRWRIHYVSWWRALTNWRLFNRNYRMKNLSWYDGYSIFLVNGDGLVVRVQTQREMPDEEGKAVNKKTPSQKIAEKIIRKPVAAATNFMNRPEDDPNEAARKNQATR